MSILKIKDSQGNWVEVQTIKGKKGDPFTYADFTPEQLESIKGKDGISPTVSVASDTSDDYRLSFTDETHTVTTPNLIPEAEKILSVYPTDSASGAVASFSDGADDIPLKSCIVQVNPVQSGSGDPSPDNVRPITGWTGCEVRHSGEDTSNPTTYPITFPTEAGTVYGAYVDVVNGELVVDRYFGTIPSNKVNISKNTTGYFWYTTLNSLSYPSIKSDNAKLIANRLRMNVNTKEIDQDGVISVYDNGIIRWKEKGELTLDEYKAYLTENPLYFCYEVKTPIHYPLTPVEIRTLLGQNNIWADTGDTEVEYRVSTKMYIDRKITEAVAAALNS